jgi:hypothetical protein
VNIPKFSFFRSDDDKLLNTSEIVVVGGCLNSKPKKVAIREPSLYAMSQLVLRMVAMMENLADSEKEWVDRVVKNPSLIRPHDLAAFKPVVELLEQELATLVGEDVEYVRHEMSPSQATEVGARWLKVVGLERIRDLFFQARAEITKIMPSREGKNIVPLHDADEPLSAKH